MKTYHFNTNIKCTACEKKIAETFTKEPKIISFKVDLNDPKRPMEVSVSEGISEAKVQSLIREAGFEATPQGGFLKSLFK